MNIRALSNPDLISRFGRLVQTERKITHLVLECIAEIDSRKIYLERAYPSLYEFLVKEFGYSPASAMRRIESARLLKAVPEIARKIEDGALNLSQLSKVQQAIKTVEKLEDRRLDESEKISLLKKIEYTSQSQTELIIAQEFSLPIIVEEREKIHRDESVTLTINFTKEQMALLEKVQDLISHSVPEGKWSEVITHLAQKELDRRTKIKRGSSADKAENAQSKSAQESPGTASSKDLNDLKSDSQVNGSLRPVGNILKVMNDVPETQRPLAQRKPIRPNLRKAVITPNSSCQFKDHVTGKVCGSTRFQQVDHKQSIWSGGTNDIRNLQTLCAQHNQLKYRKEANLR